MPLKFIVGPTIFLGCVSLVIWVFYFIDKIDPLGGVIPWYLPIISTIITLVGVGCFATYDMAEKVVEIEKECVIHNIEGMQYITYEHPDKEEPSMINVNNHFNRSFEEGYRIKVIIYDDGPYNGFYYRPKTQFEIIPASSY